MPSFLEVVDWKVHPFFYQICLQLKRRDELVILLREGVEESEEIRSQRANEVVAVPSCFAELISRFLDMERKSIKPSAISITRELHAR